MVVHLANNYVVRVIEVQPFRPLRSGLPYLDKFPFGTTLNSYPHPHAKLSKVTYFVYTL